MIKFRKLSSVFYQPIVSGSLLVEPGAAVQRWRPGTRLTCVKPRSLWSDGVEVATFRGDLPWVEEFSRDGWTLVSWCEFTDYCFKYPCELVGVGYSDGFSADVAPDYVAFPSDAAWPLTIDDEGTFYIDIDARVAAVLAGRGKLRAFSAGRQNSGRAALQNMSRVDYEQIGYYDQGAPFGPVRYSDKYQRCDGVSFGVRYIDELRGITKIKGVISAFEDTIALSDFVVSNPAAAAKHCPWLAFVLPGTHIRADVYRYSSARGNRTAFEVDIDDVLPGFFTSRELFVLANKSVTIYPDDFAPGLIKQPILVSGAAGRAFLVDDISQLVPRRKLINRDTKNVRFYPAILAGTKDVLPNATYCLPSEAEQMPLINRREQTRKINELKSKFPWMQDSQVDCALEDLQAHQLFLHETSGDNWVGFEKNAGLNKNAQINELLGFLANKYFASNPAFRKTSPFGDSSVRVPTYDELKSVDAAWTEYVFFVSRAVPLFSEIIQDPEAGSRFLAACLMRP